MIAANGTAILKRCRSAERSSSRRDLLGQSQDIAFEGSESLRIPPIFLFPSGVTVNLAVSVQADRRRPGLAPGSWAGRIGESSPRAIMLRFYWSLGQDSRPGKKSAGPGHKASHDKRMSS